ncbi:hypothetical protein QYF36_014183 [Acer negundo]|nr:hypothetical protein QYF36_014183 [Acer negundo]
MSSSRFSSSLYLLAFAFLLQTAFGADPLFHFCSSSEKFTANGPYEANLNKLAGYLYYQATPTDKDFFGQIDNQNKFYMRNVKVVCEPEAFNQNTKELLSQLAKEAQATSKLYAVGEVKLGESKKLYGLTQCTMDLSSYESFCVRFGWLFVACKLLGRTSLWVFSLLVSLLCSLLAFGQAARVLLVFVLTFGLLTFCCSFCLLWLLD